ncbi:surfactin synthase thioesterase subunit [Nocardia sp. GAS34]|uniref:thioesterase II family protein n=1 Tax=unclassified Nocardia TaxID=2637762 RepID=UPI003D222FDC
MAGRIVAGEWLRELRAVPDPRAVLVCCPPGGGSASAYRELARCFDQGTAVFAAQYPGRQDRLGDPMIPDIGALADRIADALSPGAPRLALFGHSMGATVAFEVARRLEAKGQSPIRLFVSGRAAPDVPYSHSVSRAPDAAVIAELERLANDPASVAILRAEPSLAALVLPAVRADYEAVETYRYEPGEPLQCGICAMVGDADPDVTPPQAGEWRRFTTGDFDLATFPGRHFYLDEKVTDVADFVIERLG